MEKERLEVREVGLDVSALAAAGVQVQAQLLGGTDRRTASRMLLAFIFAGF
jgi:hypothetical protein